MLSLEGAKKIRIYMNITESICINAGAGDAFMNASEKYVDVPCVSLSFQSIQFKWKPKDTSSKNALVCVTSALLMK